MDNEAPIESLNEIPKSEPQKGKSTVDILFLILVIGIGIYLVISFFHSSTFRKAYMNWQFRKAYGVTLFYGAGTIDSNNQFIAQTEDGVCVFGSCDFWGNIKTESYINYYYADESAEHIREEIASCFDDCIVVVDEDSNLLAMTEFDVNSINSYEEYLTSINGGKDDNRINVIVFLRETEDINHVVNAIEILKVNNEDFDVFFRMVSDDIYDAFKDRGVYCYYLTVSDYMQELFNSLGEENKMRFYDMSGTCYGRYVHWYDRYEIKVDGEWVPV